MQDINEKEAFSQRFKQKLAEHGWTINSPTWLAREFNLRYSGQSVSVQTASNWLSGAAIPSQDKLQILAAWLDVSSQWLRFGEANNVVTSSIEENGAKNIQLYLEDLPKNISQLNPKQKYLIYELVEQLLNQN